MFTKVCSLCQETKELSFFSLKRNKPNSRCKACVAAYYKEYREKNIELILGKSKNFWKVYKGTEAQKAVNKRKCKRYQIKNLDKFRGYVATRRAFQGKATPPWANLEVIAKMYSACPEGHEVDHIVPINNKLVCGLHVENNLQYLLSSENRSKSNKFPI